jgi:hypothetical protein
MMVALGTMACVSTAHAGPTFPVEIDGEYCQQFGLCFAAEVTLYADGTLDLWSPDLLYFVQGDWSYSVVDAEITAVFDDGSDLRGDRTGRCFDGEFFSPALGLGDFEGCATP